MKEVLFIKREKGVVLRTINFKESSLIFKFFSEKSGGVKIIAFGVKRTTNPYKGIISAGNLIEVIYHKKETSEFGKMREVKLLWKPEKIFTDYKKFLISYFLLEKIEKYIGENLRFSSIYDFTFSFLKELNSLGEVNKNVLLSLLMKFLSISGIGPELQNCIKCKRKLEDGFFITSEGGMFCFNCAKEFEEKIYIDKKNLAYLKFLLKENTEKCKNLKALNEELILNIINSFYKFYIGEDFLKNLSKILKEL
ncbi:MAG: DNA repair protein RecO [candidate division WOR-3 bacterium]